MDLLDFLRLPQMGIFVYGNKQKLLHLKYFSFGGAEARSNAELFSA